MRRALEEKGVTFQGTAVTGPDLDRLIKILYRNTDVMATCLAELPGTDILQYRIDTGDAEPIRRRSYRQSVFDRAEISRQVKEMVDAGIVEEAQSPWSSPVLLVRKKDGKWRFVCDFRFLNSITRMESYPIPTFEEILDSVAESKAQLFTSLDLFSGYWQAPLDPETSDRTGFQTSDGSYVFKRLAMGMANACSFYQRLMQVVLRGLSNTTVLIYLDDVLIMGKDPKDMEEKIQQVLNRFRASKLRIKPSKCAWSVDTVLFLGHRFDKNGISVDDSKVKVIRDFPVPINPKKVKSFLGLANYYRRFVFGFSKISAPLRQLIRKDVDFVWTQDCQEAFDKLKDMLCKAPVLALPNLNAPFILTTDASITGLAYILSQKDKNGHEKVISYGGRSVRDNESKWCISELECLAIVEGVKEYHPYLKGNFFEIFTDHVSLSFLRKMKLSDHGRLTRWSLFLQPYNFKVTYKRGVLMTSADAISRMHETGSSRPTTVKLGVTDNSKPTYASVVATGTSQQTSDIAVINANAAKRTRVDFVYDNIVNDNVLASLSTLQSLPTVDDVRSQLPSCPDFKDLLHFMQTGMLPHDDMKARRITYESSDYVLENGVLYHLFSPRTKKLERAYSVIKQLCVPTALRPAIAKALHDDLGHCGHERTYATARTRYFFPGMYSFLKEHIRTCLTCQQIKRPQPGESVPIINMPIQLPLNYWVIDFHGPFVPSPAQGHELTSCCAPFKYVLTIIDSASMWPELVPVPDLSATTVCDALFDNVVARIGLPRGISLQSDCGAGFISKLTALWAKTFGIIQRFSAPYHASTNHRAEHFALTLHQSLKVHCKKQSDWAKHLQAVAMAYRATATSNTALSPFESVFGRPMPLPIDRTLACADPTIVSTEAYAKEIHHKLAVYEQVAMQNVKESAIKHSKAHNIKADEPSFKVSDKVLLFDPTTSNNESAKLKVRWVGPYLIKEVLTNYNYKLVHLTTGKDIRRPVHASRIRALREMDNDYRLAGTHNDVILYSVSTSQRNIAVNVTVGDILQCNTDVIVNPVSNTLDLSQGLARDIADQVGSELDVKLIKARFQGKSCEYGSVIPTTID